MSPELYSLFEHKVTEWHLMRDPNFRWCSQVSLSLTYSLMYSHSVEAAIDKISILTFFRLSGISSMFYCRCILISRLPSVMMTRWLG